MEDLTTVIEDSLTDATLPEETVETTPIEEATSTPTETESVAPEASNEPTEATSDAVPSPAAKPEPDDFEKKFGIPASSSSGRENRIPYSRVKKITEKAVTDAKTDWSKSLETTHVPVERYQEIEAKVKDYEGRLTKVAEFENIMMNDQARFLEMLAGIPAYRQIFSQLVQGQTQPQQNAPVQDDMPQPDTRLSDGSMVYSMEGLKALNAWNRAQARKEVLDEVGKRFGPIENEWKAQQRIQAVLPAVQSQIETARKWPLFNENEGDIVKALQENEKLSLEGAYNKVVVPKLIANRNKIREDVLAELKKAPVRSTSVPSGQTKASPVASRESRSLEDIIAGSLKEKGLL